jgi:hypothetical protein
LKNAVQQPEISENNLDNPTESQYIYMHRDDNDFVRYRKLALSFCSFCLSEQHSEAVAALQPGREKQGEEVLKGINAASNKISAQ